MVSSSFRRLHLLLGALELLVGALQLLVGRLHLLVGGLELLVGALLLLQGRLQVVLGDVELTLELLDALQQRLRRGVRHRRQSGRLALRRQGLKQHHEALPAGIRVLQRQHVHLHRLGLVLLGELGLRVDGLVPPLRLADEAAHDHVQLGTRQTHELEAGGAGGGAEKRPDMAAKVQHLELFADDDARRHKALEQLALGDVLQVGDAPGRLGKVRRLARRRRREAHVERRRVGAVAAAIQLGLAVDRREQLRRVTDALRAAEHQAALVGEGVVQDAQGAPLRRGLQVDQQVAAGDQIDAREGRVLEQVVAREDHQVANRARHLVALLFAREEAPEAHLAELCDAGGAVDAAPRLTDAGVGDVGGEDLTAQIAPSGLEGLGHEDGQRVGLLAGGAARHPQAQGAVDLVLQLDQRLQRPLDQPRKEGWVAEELGDGDQRVEVELVDLGRRLAQVGDVGRQARELADAHAPLDAALDGGRLVVCQIEPEARLEQREQALHLLLRRGLGAVQQRQAHPLRGDDPRQLARQLLHRQAEVDAASGQGALRHAIVGGRLRALNEGHAAGGLDGTQPLGAIRAGAREHDAHGLGATVVGERAQKAVDGIGRLWARRPRREAQAPLLHDDLRVGRHHVHVIDLHRHPLGGSLHRDGAGGAVEQMRQGTVVRGREVLHHHEGHLVEAEVLHQLLQRAEASGGGTDADDEGYRRLVLRLRRRVVDAVRLVRRLGCDAVRLVLWLGRRGGSATRRGRRLRRDDRGAALLLGSVLRRPARHGILQPRLWARLLLRAG